MHLPRVRNSIRSLAGLATSKYFISVFALVCVLTLFYRSYHVSISSDGNLRLDKREGSCVGPQLTPVKRPEPYLSFAQQLAKEVARDDLVQVLAPGHAHIPGTAAMNTAKTLDLQ